MDSGRTISAICQNRHMALPIRKSVLAMRPYPPGKPATAQQSIAPLIALASNENPLGPSPKVMQAIREHAGEVNQYPDAGAFHLRAALSERFGVDFERIVLGNGSDEIIRMIGWILLDGPDCEVVVGDPSFISYNDMAALAGARLIRVPVNSKYGLDLDAMAAAVNPNTRILFVANPNNPTGTINTRAEVESLVSKVPPTCLVVLDEAYFEFAALHPDYPNGISFLSDFDNVIVLRTMSKAYGLAGMRLGYGFTSVELSDAIGRVRQPFHVNRLAQAVLLAALDDENHLARTLANNTAGIQFLQQFFADQGIKTAESWANFVLADLESPAKPVADAILNDGILVRAGGGFGMPNGLRVTVGLPAQLEAFASSFLHAWQGAAV